MQAQLVITHDPFHPMRNREARTITAPVRIRDLAPKTTKPFICVRNGKITLRKDWDDRVIDGEYIAFVTVMQGGGGSNPLRFIAMIAVMVFATWAAPALLGTTFGAYAATALGSTGLFLNVATAVIGMAGMALVNALIPPPKPTTFSSAGMPAASPTYSLQAQGNMARLEAPIPVHYGRLRFFPDFAAQPYAEYYGNEQYLYQLFCLGQGYFDVEAIQIEDTPITSWQDITYTVYEPGQTPTMFPSNVVTSGEVSGQEMLGTMTGTYTQTGTTITVTITDHLLVPGSKVYLDFTTGGGDDGAYTIVTAPTSSTFTVTSPTSEEVTTSNVTLYKYVGPFIANAAATDANYLGVDIVLPSGLFYYDSNGTIQSQTVTFSVEAQEVDDSGTPVGSFSTLGNETITAGTTTPQRFSYRYAVTPARYQVRVRRTNAKNIATGYSSTMIWGSLRAYLPETADFGNVTLLAMRMRASNQLSMQASRKINVIATRKLHTWHPDTGWSASRVATRSIAWALADILKADYGGKLPDSRIDLDKLYTLDQTWAAREDYLDGRFDSADVIWNALTTAAIAGRSKPYIQGGITHFARDEAQSFPVALFSMRNIVRGSFNIDYIMTSEETADCVDVTYFSNVNWAPQHVLCALSGSTSAKPAKITLFGVTDREHAYREGLYFAAANKYRRRLVRFATEMEGFIPSYGDLVAVQHDMPAWGQHAEATAVEYVENLLTYSEQFDNTAWNKSNTTVSNDSAASPDGSSTADKIIVSATSTAHHVERFSLDVPSGASYTISVYVKAGEITKFRFWWATTGAGARFNLSTGEVETLGGTLSATITPLENSPGWYRCTNTYVALGAMSVRMYLLDSTNTDVWTGDGTSGLYLWGAQLEESSTASPYIKTTTAARTALCVTLTEDLTWAASGSHYIGLRTKNGGMDGPIEVTWAGPNAVACVTSPSYPPYAGRDYERTHVVFGPGETYRLPARVISVRPRGTEQVEIECINEDASVHTADTGVTAPAVNYSQLATLYTAPVIAGLEARSAPDDVMVMMLSWQAASGAEYYIIEQASNSDDTVPWSRVTETRANNYSFRVSYGNATVVRVCAVGLTKGAWVTIAYGSSADYMWDSNDSTLMWSATTTDLMWR